MPELPAEFIKKYSKLLGQKKASEFFSAIDEEPKRAYRINSLKTNTHVKYSQIKPVPGVANAFYDKVSGQDPEWVSGTVYSQDPAAMFPAVVTAAQPGDYVLDLCAAPGGKSTALGEQLNGEGLLVANDISAVRAKSLRENIERWGISNAVITNEAATQLSARFPHFFDKILVDAPCSGEGMFRKDPAAIDYWSQDYVLYCQKRQKEILSDAVKMLKPGGELVYSTCTFAPEENEQIVSWLINNYAFKVIPQTFKAVSVDYGHPEWSDNNSEIAGTLRFWPNSEVGEGQFVAKLKAPAKDVGNIKKKKQKNTDAFLTHEQARYVAQILSPYNLPRALTNWQKDCRVRNNHVFIPALTNKNLHLKILNNGIELGILKKKRFEPGHQLAMVLACKKQSRVIDLSKEEYLSYLHGETLKTKSTLNSFVLLSYCNFIFSFGKIANGTIKNFYPKGLRSIK